MRKTLCFLAFFILTIIVCHSDNSMIVRNLTVEDNPYDDGTGLIIRFEPLDRSARIIEYRLYRGVTPETLFFIGSVEVNPNTGIPGGEVTFYDKDSRVYVDVDSPRRMRNERGQLPGSPIYRAVPRDVGVVGSLLEHFYTFGVIDKNIFYRKTTKHLSEPTEEGHQELLGGLRIEDFLIIYFDLMPGKEYFYSVLAVDERRNFHPYAPIISGIASDNQPQPATNLYVKWIEDTQVLNFEFDYPLFTGDIAQTSIYMIDRAEIDAFEAYKQFMFELDKWNRLTTEGDTLAVRPSEINNPGQLLTVIPATTRNFTSVQYEDGHLINEVADSLVVFDIEDTQSHVFYVVLEDYSGFQSISELAISETVNSELLPILPNFMVRDKPSDKGDANEIIIGKPLVQLTRVSFRGRARDRTKLTITYDYSPIPTVGIRSINFRFVDNFGNTFDSVTEHFLDNVFNLDLPSERYFYEGFKVYMSFNLAGKSGRNESNRYLSEEYLSQSIHYDEDLLMLKPGNLYSDGDEMMAFRYQILKQSRSDRLPRIQSRITPLINFFDDFVGYEMYIGRGIASYDVERNQLLFDTTIDITLDPETGSPLMTNIFYEDFVRITRQQIAHYQSIIPLAPDEEGNDSEVQDEIDPFVIEEAMWMIEHLNNTLENQTSNPILSEINQIRNHRDRISRIISLREYNRRSFRYHIVKTNSQALFTISDIYVDANGNEYIYPTSDWFNNNTIPMLVATLIFGFLVFYSYSLTKSGKDLFIRPIAGIEEIDNAVGRATEMGRPMLFVPGLTSIDDVATLAALSILGHITKKAAQYDTKILVPVSDYIVLPIAQQIVKESYSIAGRPDSFDSNDVFFVAFEQFAYVAGVNGIMIRQKTATNFYMGYFFAEALVMTETGNMTGAIQVAGTDAVTQIPFFITTCDYTLIGEELYAASAYLSKDPMILGTLKSQDYTKLIIIICILVGTILSTINVTGMINWFPAE
ncbi:MAG: hypothetical protein FWG98_03665 [Candidatus Cloacimonetes bacterium]|nr:hypothetical protein [Candidatus Cloacimonadota bacterium]